MKSAYEAVMAFRTAIVNEDLNVRDQLGTELDEFQDVLKFGHQAVDPLVSLLEDDDAHVRCTIAHSLHFFATDLRLILHMVQALSGDPHAGVRAAAAFTLGEIGHIMAADALISACQDSESKVRFQAIQALRHFKGYPPAVDAIISAIRTDTDQQNCEKAENSLFTMGEFAELKSAIDAGLVRDRRIIAKTLGETGGTGAFEYLVLLLRSEGNSEEQETLLNDARTVLKWNDGKLESLEKCIEGNNAFDLKEAALALGKLGDSRAIDYLCLATDHSHWLVRQAAAQALYMLDKEVGVQAMLKLLRSPSKDMLKPFLRFGFTTTGDQRVIDRLLEMLSDPDPDIRWHAARDLAETRHPLEIQALQDYATKGVSWAIRALKEFGYTPPMDGVVDLLNSAKSADILPAIAALIEFPDARAVESLERLLQSEDGSIVEASLLALGIIADAHATSAIAGVALSSDDVRLRKPAAWALSQIDTREAEEVLLQVLERRDLGAMSAAYRFYIIKGVSGSDRLLVDVLNYYGHKAMAEDYTHSGNSILSEAGDTWLKEHPYVKYTETDWEKASGPKWASKLSDLSR